MAYMKSMLAVLGLSLFFAAGAAAETDAKGCKDHPLFNRISGFWIFECKKNYNQLNIQVDSSPKSDRNLKPEGDLSTANYIFKKTPELQTPPSDLQVMRNYQNAAKAKGGEVLVDKPGYTAMKFKRDAGTVYAVVSSGSGGYRLRVEILEEKAMEQEVTANLMWDALKKDGFIALQINFDTNKAVIKQESLPLVKQIVELMRGAPGLKVSIEGHTDSQGAPAANKTLSMDRAKAVVAAVAAEGIAPNRMEAVGWGQEKPVADNRTEEGRAKNRRVELVKK